MRSKEDVLTLKELIGAGKSVAVISKIEKPVAVKRIEEIMRVSDALMIARGDLGIEIGIEKVPVVQKKLIKLARQKKKYVITATQMLESMMERPRPTRTEASDVANAVLDGSDAVMLSGETAIGKYPIETVRMMARIVREAEDYLKLHAAFKQSA